MKHIVSRLTVVPAAICVIVARILDLIIGVVSTLLSILAFGKITVLNDAAFNGLSVTGIIGDIIAYPILFINPTANDDNS